MTGLHIALLGIDGLGKTTLTQELADLARANGRRVHLVSWRGYLENGGPRTYPRDQLERLWVHSFRLYFGTARNPDGTPLDLPVSYADLNARGGTEYLNDTGMVGMHGRGPLAAAWIELAANTLLHTAVIRPLVDAGDVVLQESFGYKHLAKLFSVAAEMSPELAAPCAVGQDLVAGYFATHLRPDVGIHVAGDPELALRWRLAQSGRPGTFESLEAAGEDPAESFLRIARETAERFGTFAEKNGWITAEVTDAPREANRARILGVLAGSELAGVLGLAAG